MITCIRSVIEQNSFMFLLEYTINLFLIISPPSPLFTPSFHNFSHLNLYATGLPIHKTYKYASKEISSKLNWMASVSMKAPPNKGLFWSCVAQEYFHTCLRTPVTPLTSHSTLQRFCRRPQRVFHPETDRLSYFHINFLYEKQITPRFLK